MRSADGTPVVPHIATKQALLEEVVKIIPTLASRHNRIKQIEAAKEQIAKQRVATLPGAPKAARSKEDKKEERKLAKKHGKGR